MLDAIVVADDSVAIADQYLDLLEQERREDSLDDGGTSRR